MPKVKVNRKKKESKRKLKGLAGIVAAAASTKNVKPVFAGHPYFKAEFEKFWEGRHIFGEGTIKPGFFKRLRGENKKIVNGEKKKRQKEIGG